MVVQCEIMAEEDDLEALRLAALQTIKPRKTEMRKPFLTSFHHNNYHHHHQHSHHYQNKKPSFKMNHNSNLIFIVPTDNNDIKTPSTSTEVKSGSVNVNQPGSPQLPDETPKPIVVEVNTQPVTKKEELSAEKCKKVPPKVKRESKDDDLELRFDEEELDFESESTDQVAQQEDDVVTLHVDETDRLAVDESVDESDTLALHDDDGDSLEKLMDEMEQEFFEESISKNEKTKTVEIPKTEATKVGTKKKSPSPKESNVPEKDLVSSSNLIAIKKKSPAQQKSRSPVPRRLSRSPPYIRTRSPLLRRSRSPVYRRSLSPRRSPLPRRSRSPVCKRSRSPVSKRSRSPLSKRSRSPLPKRSRSPFLNRSRSPMLKRSRSPLLRRSRSPLPRRSRSPFSRRSKSPYRRPSPYRRSKSPIRRRTPPRRLSPLPRRSPRRSPPPLTRRSRTRSRTPPRRDYRSRSPLPLRRRSRSSSFHRRSASVDRRKPLLRRSVSPRRRSPSPIGRSTLRRKTPPPPLRRSSPLPRLVRRRSVSPSRRVLSRRSPLRRQLRPVKPSETQREDLRSSKLNQRGRTPTDNRVEFDSRKELPSKAKADEVSDKKKPEPIIDADNYKLEARRKKFELNAPVSSIQKKIYLKTDDLRNKNDSDMPIVIKSRNLNDGESNKDSVVFKETASSSLKSQASSPYNKSHKSPSVVDHGHQTRFASNPPREPQAKVDLLKMVDEGDMKEDRKVRPAAIRYTVADAKEEIELMKMRRKKETEQILEEEGENREMLGIKKKKKKKNKEKKKEKKKKEKEIIEIIDDKAVTSRVSGAGGTEGQDLRAELSRRRAQRLQGQPGSRLIQSALEGVVADKKIKPSRLNSPTAESSTADASSKSKGRRVHVVNLLSKKNLKGDNSTSESDEPRTDEEKKKGKKLVSSGILRGTNLHRRSQVTMCSRLLLLLHSTTFWSCYTDHFTSFFQLLQGVARKMVRVTEPKRQAVEKNKESTVQRQKLNKKILSVVEAFES